MAKYDPLRDFLTLQTAPILVLGFPAIERILGAPLPASAKLPHWWANTVDRYERVQREAWRAARYDAFLRPGPAVQFVRIS